MTNRMEEIGARLEAAACVYPNTTEGLAALADAEDNMLQHAHDDLIFMHERIASLEALVRELATAAACAKSEMGEHMPGKDFSYVQAYEMLKTALSHPLVSELIGMKEEGE